MKHFSIQTLKHLTSFIAFFAIAGSIFGQSFKVTFSDHNAAQDLVDTTQWQFVGKNMDRYHAGWTFTTRNILTDMQRQSIIRFIGDKPVDIEFDPNEPQSKVQEYMDNIEKNGGKIGIITYYMEPKFVAADQNQKRRGGATLVTPDEMIDIQNKIKATGRDPQKYQYRGIIRLFSLTDEVSRAWIKQYGNLTYEIGLPFEHKGQLTDIANAVRWCYDNDVNLFLMMVPAYKGENSPFGMDVPNPEYLQEYQQAVNGLGSLVDLKNERLNFVVAGYNYKFKKVPIVPEGKGDNYINTISGVTRWLIDYRETLNNK